MRSATSIGALGAGAHDGERALISYGSQRRRLRWKEPDGAWYSEPESSITQRDLLIMSIDAPIINSWAYVSHVNDGGAGTSPGPWGWSPRAILDADDAYAAGLVLQEHCVVDFWTFNPPIVKDLAVVFYNRDALGGIAPGTTPDDTAPGRDVGVIMTSLPGQRRWQVYGWQDSPISAPTAQHLLPHLYGRRQGAEDECRLEYIAARWRWKGTP